jgi:hypothetical protein
MTTSFCRASIFFILLFAASVARGADTPGAQADDLINQGFQLRLQGKNAEALDLFMRAHALAPSSKTLGQIGSAELALHRWIDAETHLEDALSRKDGPWIESHRASLEKSLAEAQQQIGRVEFRGPVGADISVDGRHVGTLPLPAPVHVGAGSAHVVAVATGYTPLQEDIPVRGGETKAVPLVLLPTVPVAAPSATPTLVQTAQSPRSAKRRWFGGGLALVGLTGVGFGIGWLTIDNRPTCDAPAGGVCQHLYDTKTRGWVSLGVGAALTAAGAGLVLWPSGHSSSPEGYRTSGLVVGPGILAFTTPF